MMTMKEIRDDCECDIAAQIRESNTFTNEQLIQLLTRGRVIIPEWGSDTRSRGRQDTKIQLASLTIDEGGKPVKVMLSCHDLVSLVNYIAKEVLQ
jgi:hypothetical protein